MRLVTHLRETRDELGLSIRDMSDRTGINRGSLSKFERGKELPSDELAELLELHYGTPRSDWYFRDGRFQIVEDEAHA